MIWTVRRAGGGASGAVAVPAALSASAPRRDRRTGGSSSAARSASKSSGSSASYRSGLDPRRERPSPGSVWSKRLRERAGRLEVQSRSSISGSESAASRVNRRSGTSRGAGASGASSGADEVGTAGTATLDRLTDVLDVGPPCPGLAVWHALTVLFPGLTGLADGLALKESRYAEGDSPQ